MFGLVARATSSSGTAGAIRSVTPSLVRCTGLGVASASAAAARGVTTGRLATTHRVAAQAAVSVVAGRCHGGSTRGIATSAVRWDKGVPFASVAAAEEGLVGSYRGVIAIEGMEIPVVYHIARGADGKLAATMDSPQQNVFGYELPSVSVEEIPGSDGKSHGVVIDMGGGATYSAAIVEEGQVLHGMLSQGGDHELEYGVAGLGNHRGGEKGGGGLTRE